jgi:uncharacterized protein (TIGR03790 family)
LKPTAVRLIALLAGLLAGLLAATLSHAGATVLLPHTGLLPDELALLVNDDDPLSRQIGDYYQRARHLPAANVIHLRFPPGRSVLSGDEFGRLKAEIDRATPAHVQAYAVAWSEPYRVGCMSITSALAFGFDERYCSVKCGPTAPSPYFNSTSHYPRNDHQLRPAMMLAGTGFAQVRALIDRGIAADQRFPSGRAYLLSTPDKTRSVRAAQFEQTAKSLAGVFPIDILETGAIENRHDVLFYFTGLAQVPKLETLTFVPGALADHLTSFGGQLTDSASGQMSSLRWLEAGATASYGTVVEPCNHPQKFPLPAVAMFHYANGASAIEAYWKSVAWPGEGLFVGEPLARPFAPKLQEISPGQFELQLFLPREGWLRIESSASMIGPFKALPQQQAIHRGVNRLRFSLPEAATGYFRLLW